jgi:hypothetical protein
MIILAKKQFGDNPFLTNALWIFSIFQTLENHMEKTERGRVGCYLSSPQNPRNPKCKEFCTQN